MASSTIGWQAMGKPDFSQAGKLFYRLPADLREGMGRSEEKVLVWAIFLSWFSSVHSGRGNGLASFSETWLGAKFGRSRWTVGRALARLEEWSLLKRIRRNPRKDGTFQTNLIALGARLTSIFGAKSAQVRDKSPCSKTAPQEVGTDYKREETTSFKSQSLLSSPEQEEMWKKEAAGAAKKASEGFYKLLRGPKLSVSPA